MAISLNAVHRMLEFGVWGLGFEFEVWIVSLRFVIASSDVAI